MNVPDRRHALLEKMRKEEGSDPVKIAERLMEFPNSGNGYLARSLAEALLAEKSAHAQTKAELDEARAAAMRLATEHGAQEGALWALVHESEEKIAAEKAAREKAESKYQQFVDKPEGLVFCLECADAVRLGPERPCPDCGCWMEGVLMRARDGVRLQGDDDLLSEARAYGSSAWERIVAAGAIVIDDVRQESPPWEPTPNGGE